MSPAGSKNPVALFFGMLAVVGLVAAITYGGVLAVRAVGNRTTFDPGVGAPLGSPSPNDTTPDRLPRKGQLLVTGTVTAARFDQAQIGPLATPLEIVTPERGNGAGATFQHATVDGDDSTIVWDAGRPLELAGAPGEVWLELPRSLSIDGTRLTVDLDGVHSFTVGGYQINSPVAVGAAALARPVDSVTFDATAETRVRFRGDATTTISPQDYTIKGPGRLILEGDLQVTKPDGESDRSEKVEFEGGPYEITLHLAEGGFTIEAILQGDAKT